MARKTTVELVDDLTGEVASDTVQFGIDGVSYEIDLTDENAEKLRDALRVWVEKSRRIGGRKRPGGVGGAARPNDAAKVREWARENGYEVPDRGRIPSEIREAYEAGVPNDEKPAAEAPADEKPADDVKADEAPAEETKSSTKQRSNRSKAADKKDDEKPAEDEVSA